MKKRKDMTDKKTMTTKKKNQKDSIKSNKSNKLSKPSKSNNSKTPKSPKEKQSKPVQDLPVPVGPSKNYPVNSVNPFMTLQFLTKDESVIVMASKKKQGVIIQNVTHHHKVSKEECLDLFCAAIKEKLELTSGGVRTFRYLYGQVQESIGLSAKNLSLFVDKADCMDKARYTSIQSVFNGINELLEAGIIAKSGKINVYFINPNFFRPADCLIITEHYTV